MEGLLRIQNFIQNSIVKDHAFQGLSRSTLTRSWVKVRLESLDNTWSQFERNHYALLSMDEFRDDCEYLTSMVYDQVEKVFLEYKSELWEALSLMKDIAATDGLAEKRKVEHSKFINLPTIEIPAFSGKYTEWPTFHNLFDTLIHNNSDLNNIHKLYYLKSKITGEAEQLLSHIAITENNYEKCWSLLKARYGNKRYLVNNIMNRLFGQVNLKFEDSKGIKQLLDTTNECINALSNLDVDTSTWDIIIIHLVSEKLDQESRKQWEQRISYNFIDNLPSLRDFLQFLEARFRTLEYLELREKKSKDDRAQRTHVFATKYVTVTANKKCPYCGGSHVLDQCPEFFNQEHIDRVDFIRSKKICFNCFGAYHKAKRCRHHNACQRCNRRHHTLLHAENSLPSSKIRNRNYDYNKNTNNGKPSIGSKNINSFSNSVAPVDDVEVILPTALVRVDTKKSCASLGTLLDQGSQASLISEKAVQLLGLRKIPVKRVLSGVGGEEQTLSVEHMVELTIQSTAREFCCNIQACVLNSLPSTQSSNSTNRIKKSYWPDSLFLDLANPNYDKQTNVDLVLGADVYGLILQNGITRDSSGNLTAQNTKLGWVVSGRVPAKTKYTQYAREGRRYI